MLTRRRPGLWDVGVVRRPFLAAQTPERRLTICRPFGHHGRRVSVHQVFEVLPLCYNTQTLGANQSVSLVNGSSVIVNESVLPAYLHGAFLLPHLHLHHLAEYSELPSLQRDSTG